jgi:hypothetical protein
MYWSNVIYSVLKFFIPKLVFLSVRWQKNGSFGFSALAQVSAKTKCAICAVGCLFTMRHNGWRIGDGRGLKAKA